MKFLSRLIDTKDDFLLKAKRFLFREAVQTAEKGMEMQYLHSSVRGLREEYERLEQQDQANREKVDEIFERRKEAIQQLWTRFIEEHQDDDDEERVDRLREGQTNILRRLDEVHAELLERVNARPPAREIQERHTERLRTFRDGHRRQAPEGGANPPEAERPITSPRDLFQSPEGRGRETTRNPDRQQVSAEFIQLARQWRPAISMRFCVAFATKLLSQSRNISLLRSGLQHPEELRRFVQTLYEAYRATHPRESTPSMTQFFERESLQAENVQSAMTQLLGAIQGEQAQEEWNRTVDQQTEMVTDQAADEMFNRLEASLVRHEIPGAADLIQLQKLGQYVQREFLNGEPLRWSAVEFSQIVPGRYEVPVQRRIPVIGTTPPLGRVLAESSINLQGRSFEISRVFDSRNLQNPSRTVTRVNGLEKNFDLPHFVMILKRLHETYPETRQGENVNFSQLHREVTEHEQQLRERLHAQRYRELMDTLQFSNPARFENFPQALTSFLDQGSLQEKKSGSDWLNQIKNLQGNQNMDDDNYKFLWMLRFMSRTRNVSENKSSTVTEFAQELFEATEYRDLQERPDQTMIDVARDFEDLGGTTKSIREDRLRFEYRAVARDFPLYQHRLPVLRDIFVFAQRDYPLYNPNNPEISRTLQTTPWSEAVAQLEQAERIGYVSAEGDVVISDRRRTAPSFLFNKGTVEAYSRLKQNNPLFRELVSLGMAGKSSTLTLNDLVHSVLTPNSTRDSVNQVPGR